MLELPAMALETHPDMFTPEALADESLFDEEEPATRPGRIGPRAAASRRQPRMRDPDAQAVEIVTRVAEKLAVARSLVRILGSYARENVDVAGGVLRAYADHKMAEIIAHEGGASQGASQAASHADRARRVAAAAAEAAKHAAQLAAARAAARAQEVIADAASALDHEKLHDDAC
jgi:hypothetical protein